MRTLVIGVAAAALMALAAGTASADYDSTRGTIKSIDADAGKIVITVRSGRGADATSTDQTFLIDKDTTIRIGKDKKAIADLAKDKFVTITFKTAAKEGDIATAVLIVQMDMPMGGGRGGAGGAGGAGGGRGNRGGGNGAGGAAAAPGPQL